MNTQRMLEHLRTLASRPRPNGSREERRAADYVRGVLKELGIDDVQTQTFRTPASSGWTVIPLATVLAFAALLRGRLGKLIGGGVVLSAAAALRRAMLVEPLPFTALVPQVESQNVIARIPSVGETRQMIFLIGHLDSNRQRFTFPQIVPPLTKPFNTLVFILALFSGLSMLRDALSGRKDLSRLQLLTGLIGLVTTATLFYDEMQPYVDGANDNATAVALLLGLGEALKEQPLQHTEVTLLFTGSEETGCNGMEAYLQQYPPPLDDSYFIDIEMVGTGDLCYVTKHGISHFSEYRPAPIITALAAQVARQHPELGVKGKALTILEEVASLRNRGYEAICIAGYDRTGMLPNWHRVTDTLDKIDPDTLTRAAQYVHTLIDSIDAKMRA